MEEVPDPKITKMTQLICDRSFVKGGKELEQRTHKTKSTAVLGQRFLTNILSVLGTLGRLVLETRTT